MQSLFLTVVAGILASLAMASFMYSVHLFGLANGDMIRALGSFYKKDYNGSFFPGLFMYLVGGILFAAIYIFIWKYFEIADPTMIVATGALMGLAHGFCLSFFLIILVAEHHPLDKFRQAGFGVALTHILGHVVYGAVLGFLVMSYASYYPSLLTS